MELHADFPATRAPAMQGLRRTLNTRPDLPLPAAGAQDTPLPIGYGETISAPHMHATCLELLRTHLKPGARVLDVGSGSGYLTSVFGRMVRPGGKVIGIEKHPELAEQSVINVRGATPELLEEGVIEVSSGRGACAHPCTFGSGARTAHRISRLGLCRPSPWAGAARSAARSVPHLKLTMSLTAGLCVM